MYDSIPLPVAIPLFLIMVGLLIWLKIRDHRRAAEVVELVPARSSEELYYEWTGAPQHSESIRHRSETPIYDQLADEHLTYETRNRIEKEAL